MSSASNVRTTGLAAESARWSVDEQDGAVIILKRIGEDRLVLVEHDGARWLCSECGDQPMKAGLTCAHTTAATKNLPRAVAAQIANRIAKPTRTPTAKSPKVSAHGKATIRRPAGPNAGQRFEARDEDFRRITSEVTVRRMTDADRQRLAERRKHKRISSG